MTDQHCLLCKQCAALAELCATTAVGLNVITPRFDIRAHVDCQENRMCMIVTAVAQRYISNRTFLSDIWVHFLPARFFFFFKLSSPLTLAQQVQYVRYDTNMNEKLPDVLPVYQFSLKRRKYV